MKIVVLNGLIAARGLMLLYDGQLRNRFLQTFAQLTDNQQIGQALIVIVSLMIMSLAVSDHLAFKMIAITAFVFDSCWCYHDLNSIATLLSHLLLTYNAIQANLELEDKHSSLPLHLQRSQSMSIEDKSGHKME